jgi:hypothetical protein
MTKAAAYGSRLAFGSTSKAFTVTAADDIFTSALHGYADTQPVMIVAEGLTGATGVIAKKVYYVRDSTTNTFKLALTSGGAAINITADGSGSIRALADIAQVASLSGPNLQAATIDVTTHDSPSAIREFVSGLIDPGEFSGELVFDPNLATHIGLWTDLVNRAGGSFAFHFPTLLAFSMGFEGVVTGFGPIQAQPDGAVTAAFTVKISGAPNVT